VNPTDRPQPSIAVEGEQLEWPALITTVLFATSKIHIVLHCRVQSGHRFTRLRHVSPSCRELGWACALSPGSGESNLRRRRLARAKQRLWEREESFFENVITDYHLLSFLGRRDRSNAVVGNEKRQKSQSRPGVVGREARFRRGTEIRPVASDLRRKALAWWELHDWEWDRFLCIRPISSHFSCGEQTWLGGSRERTSRTWIWEWPAANRVGIRAPAGAKCDERTHL